MDMVSSRLDHFQFSWEFHANFARAGPLYGRDAAQAVAHMDSVTIHTTSNITRG